MKKKHNEKNTNTAEKEDKLEEKVEETTEESTPDQADSQASEDSSPEEGETSQQAEEEPAAQPHASAPGQAEDKDQLLRLKAEYDNFRKRTNKEKIALRDDVLRQTACEFLPVYDNLSRALLQTCQDEAFQKGVEMTMNQLLLIMEKLELEKIPAVGELFDPKLHEALARVDDERWGENTITDVFIEGFTHKDKVIRFAQVRVAN